MYLVVGGGVGERKGKHRGEAFVTVFHLLAGGREGDVSVRSFFLLSCRVDTYISEDDSIGGSFGRPPVSMSGVARCVSIESPLCMYAIVYKEVVESGNMFFCHLDRNS